MPLRPSTRHELRAWLWSAVGVAPYLLVYLFHALPGDDHPPGWEPTGFVQSDQHTYVAHGRAVFAHGNGVSGPNPYEADPNAPDIYFHWINWILGVGVGVLDLGPGRFYMGFGIVSAVVLGRLTMALVEQAGAGPYRVPLTLLALWGGGIAVLMAWADDHGARWSSPSGDPLRFEPTGGWWMPAWGRNVVYTTEAFYHSLMAGTWLLALRRRWGPCLVALAILASTHPFTGTQALAIFLGWSILVELGPPEGRGPAWFAIGVIGLAILFFGYHLAFLPRHLPHRELQERWALDWSERPMQTLATYAPVGALALARLARDRGRIGREAGFFWTCALASFALSHHHWVIPPRQPLHFTHGYVWMPLFLLGVPLLRDVLDWARGEPAHWVVLGAAGALACLDNAVWLANAPHSQEVRGSWLPPGARPALRAIERLGLRGVLACPDAGVAAMVGVYSDVLPLYAHMGYTSDYFDRRREVSAWLERGERGPSIDRIDILLVRDEGPLPEEVRRGWDRVYRGGGWSVYCAPGASTGGSPDARGDRPR